MIFPAPYRDAIAGVQYDYSNKIAFEARRFWEAEQIYGGITFVGGETALIWYPSDGLHNARAGCCSDAIAPDSWRAPFSRRSIAEQIAAARAAIEMAHPGHGGDCVSPVVINWHKIPYSHGAMAGVEWCAAGAAGRSNRSAGFSPAPSSQPDA